MTDKPAMIVTGSRKGIGLFLTKHYLELGWTVYGCSRKESEFKHENYYHFCLDVVDEAQVTSMFSQLRKGSQQLVALINNAGIASMNHSLLTPLKTVNSLLETNVAGSFLFCREAAKIMKKSNFGRIVNFTSVADPLRLEGEAIYAASKAAVSSLTRVLAREFADYGITVNALGPTPIKTDLIRGVPEDKLTALLNRQAIKRYGELEDVSNATDFFLSPESSFVTGQVLYLGGV